MLHKNIIQIYNPLFSTAFGDITEWFPNGRDSVRIRTDMHRELIFTYHNETNWCLETVNSYCDHMKGDKKR